MAGDQVWLRNSLAKTLGWDEQVAEGVVEALAAAQSQEEVDELVQGYLGGSAEVKQLVQQFLGMPNQQLKQKAPAATGPTGRQLRPGERQAGSVTVRHVAGRQAAAARPGPGGSSAPEKDVCNCLCCGKIYFTRQDKADVMQFLEQGGHCTFCGVRVSLTFSGVSESRPSASQRSTSSLDASEPGTSADAQEDQKREQSGDADTAAAREFKDRLVDYDRNSRQRTTVVDDQNDFFEIDTNSWLDPEEREQLKRQERELRDAEEARRRRVTVTIDLLGRRVVMADDEEPTEQAVRNAQATLAAARATGSEIPQGGGTATATALSAAARIQPNLSLKAERPMFVPTTPETADERRRRRGVPTAQSAAAGLEGDEPQGVIGGWGNEVRSSAYGSGMTADDARTRSAKMPSIAAGSSSAPASADMTPQARNASRSTVPQKRAALTGKAKRPQLKRVQHDNPFDAVDTEALG